LGARGQCTQVNLLIAMMTSTYERIRSESQFWRAVQYCESAIEFKDERSVPPPLNLLTRPLGVFASKHLSESRTLSRGFTTRMDAVAMKRVAALEQRCAIAFHQQSVRDGMMTVEARIADIAEKMPVVDLLLRRTEGLEEAVRSLADMVQGQQTLLERCLQERAPDPDGSHRGASQRPGCGRSNSRERSHGRHSTIQADVPAKIQPRLRSSVSSASSRLLVGRVQGGALPPPTPGSCSSSRR
jgi:hypothetical protein